MGHMQAGCLDNFILYIIYCGFVGFKKKKNGKTTMSFFLSSCHYIEPHCFIVHIVDGSYKKTQS